MGAVLEGERDTISEVGAVVAHEVDHPVAVVVEGLGRAETNGEGFLGLAVDAEGDFEVGFEPVFQGGEGLRAFEVVEEGEEALDAFAGVSALEEKVPEVQKKVCTRGVERACGG